MAVRASLVLVIMLMVSVCETEETCADVEFPGYKDGETVRASVNSYINVTFHLNTSYCTYTPDWFRFKVSFSQASFNVGICSILIQNRTCSITDQSVYCRCTHDARDSAILYKQFNQSGLSVYIWNWSDSVRKQVQKKAQISFDVQDDNGSTHDSTVTSTSGIPTAAGGDNLNVIFVTSAITATVIIVPIIIVISVYVYRRRKARETHPSADDRLEENPDTALSQSLPLQENRRSLRKEYEYSEITDEAAPRNSSPDRVHENYEHPLQDEGAGHSDYSRLVYKGLWRNGNGNGNGKDDSNTKMAELPVSDVATTEEQSSPTVTRCHPDDYLEPVPTDTGTTSPALPKLAS